MRWFGWVFVIGCVDPSSSVDPADDGSLRLVSAAHDVSAEVDADGATLTARGIEGRVVLVSPDGAGVMPEWTPELTVARDLGGVVEWWSADAFGLQLGVSVDDSSVTHLAWAMSGEITREPDEVARIGHAVLRTPVAYDADGARVPAEAALSCATEGCTLDLDLDLAGAALPVQVAMSWVDGETTPGQFLGDDGMGMSTLAAHGTCYTDADGDGFGNTATATTTCTNPALVHAAGDCNDGAPSVYPGAPEVPSDGTDQDCNGVDPLWAMSDLVAGDLVVSELMLSPRTTPGVQGEWFEVENRSGLDVNLSGLYLGDDPAATYDHWTIGTLDATVGQQIVFAGNATANNSNVPVDVIIPRVTNGVGFALSEVDEMIVRAGETGLQFDRVAWGTGWPRQTGRSMSLDSRVIDAIVNDDKNPWCAPNSPEYFNNHAGTPGTVNAQCNFGGGSVPVLPVSTPPASLCFTYSYTNAVSGAVVPAAPTVIEIDFVPGTTTSGTFATSNAGTGMWESGNNATGIWLTWTYDITGAVYRGVKPTAGTTYSGPIRIGHPWTGTWTQVTCPP